LGTEENLKLQTFLWAAYREKKRHDAEKVPVYRKRLKIRAILIITFPKILEYKENHLVFNIDSKRESFGEQDDKRNNPAKSHSKAFHPQSNPKRQNFLLESKRKKVPASKKWVEQCSEFPNDNPQGDKNRKKVQVQQRRRRGSFRKITRWSNREDNYKIR